MTTKTTEKPKMTKEQMEKARIERQKSPSFTNLKMKVSAKNELSITLPLADFKMDELVKDGVYDKLLEKYHTSKNGNVVAGGTFEYLPIEREGFEHLAFSVSVICKTKAVQERIEHEAKKAEMQRVSAEGVSKPVVSGDTVTMSKAEYDEMQKFMAFAAKLMQQQQA